MKGDFIYNGKINSNLIIRKPDYTSDISDETKYLELQDRARFCLGIINGVNESAQKYPTEDIELARLRAEVRRGAYRSLLMISEYLLEMKEYAREQKPIMVEA